MDSSGARAPRGSGSAWRGAGWAPGDSVSVARDREEPARGRTAVRRKPARLIFMDPFAACSRVPCDCIAPATRHRLSSQLTGGPMTLRVTHLVFLLALRKPSTIEK